MINGYYSGFHYLDLITAFKNAAWEGIMSFGPSYDPIMLSLSNFKQLCESKNIDLSYSPKLKSKGLNLNTVDYDYFPIIFVISGNCTEIEEILDWVKAGANFIYLNPIEIYINTGLENENEKTISLINSKIGGNILEENFSINYGKGKIFGPRGIGDGGLEDYFGGKNSLKGEKRNDRINSMYHLIEQISSFNIPLVDIELSSIPKTFPVNEPMFFEIIVKNIGNTNIDRLKISIELPMELESISSTFIELSGLKKGDSESIPLVSKALYKGSLNSELVVNIEYPLLCKTKFLLPFEINILNNLKKLIENTFPLNIDIESKIKEFEEYLIPTTDSVLFIKLLEVDPDGLIAKIRRISEYTIKKIAQTHLQEYNPRWSLADLIKKLHEQQIIDKKIKSYADTIRLFGNIASHSDIDETVSFTTNDAIVVSNALILFISECISKGII